MDREKIIQYVAEWFGIEPDEDGKYDLSDYEWTSGCYHNHIWLCLKEIVDLFEHISDEECLYDFYDED